MSLRYAILGLLCHEPMTGYELKTRWFDKSIAHFWSADQSQIYRMMDRLVSENLARVEPAPSVAGPPRKVYSITDGGRRTLDAWLASEPDPAPTRDGELVRLFFAHRVNDEVVLAHLAKLEQLHSTRLAVYDKIPLSALGRGQTAVERQHRMTLEYGILHSQMVVAWARRCQESLPSASSNV